MPISNEVKLVPIEGVYIGEARQRKSIDQAAVDSLADSMRRIGLIHPIVITRLHVLVAGECRLRAAKKLGWREIKATYQDETSPEELKIAELEENLKRKNLTWQEEVEAVSQIHAHLAATNEGWSYEKTGLVLGLVKSSVHRYLSVAKEAVANPTILKASGISAAANALDRKVSRKLDSDLVKLLAVEEEPEPEHSRPWEVVAADFNSWAQNYSGLPFNLLHCDFPYGIKMDTSKLQGTRTDFERYADSEGLYLSLLNTLGAYRHRLLAPASHIVFWFSMNYFDLTREALSDIGAVNPFPLIWHKADGKGIVPDPERGPRRTYETAFLVSIGDRKIVRPVNNSIAEPTNKSEALHLSEKPEAVVKHFLSMLVDSSTRLLDPTCGSGTALSASLSLGAERVVGVDISEDNVKTTLERIQKAKTMESLLGK